MYLINFIKCYLLQNLCCIVYFIVATTLCSVVADASTASTLSDPAGLERGSNRDHPLHTDLSTRLKLNGYYRMRWDLLHQLDLKRGPTPSTGLPIFPTSTGGQGPLNTADMRLRLDLDFEVARSVKVVVRVDALDNVVLGSTPIGLPRNRQVPSIVATTGQQAPEAGINALADSIRLQRAYGEVILPFGYLAVGRMGALTPWGLGILVHPGNDLDADYGDVADRAVLALAILKHILLLAYEWSASGPLVTTSSGLAIDQDPRDDVRSFGLALAKYDSPLTLKRKLNAGQLVINYGLLFTYRYQHFDTPTYYENAPTNRPFSSSDQVQRDAWSLLLSFWFLLRTPWLRIELETIYAQGAIANSSLVPGIRLTEPITSQQFGGALQFAIAPPIGRWGIGLEFGLASGDDAPGFGLNAPLHLTQTQPGDIDGPQIRYPHDLTVNNFRFHPNYRIDQIFWRRIIGSITDAIYLKAAAHFDITPRLRFWSALIYSRAFFSTTPPGNDPNLGIELNTGLLYDYDPGFHIRFTFAAFFPFAGLRNIPLNLEAQPAVSSHLLLGYIL
jgi:uncharacterized protein (TIGR04551 family)